MPEIGTLIPKNKLSGYFNLKLSKEPVYLTERLVYLGEIERTNEFEAKKPVGKTLDGGIEYEIYASRLSARMPLYGFKF